MLRKHLKSGAENLAGKHKQKAIDLYYIMKEMLDKVPKQDEKYVKDTLLYQSLDLRLQWHYMLFDFYDKISKLL